MAITPKQVPTITDPAKAEALLQSLRAIVAELSTVLAEESAIVGAARLRETQGLAARKSELSRRYAAGFDLVKANTHYLRETVPQELALLKVENAVLQQQLEHNLVILGTAHAVAEGIVRGVSSAVDKRRTPPTYGANGRSATPRRSGPSPMALSRIL